MHTHTRVYVTRSGKIGLITLITDIHFLSLHESCTHALPRNTKYWIIDSQVCFYRRLSTNAVKLRGCISWPKSALIGLHGVQNCSRWQSSPPLWIVSVSLLLKFEWVLLASHPPSPLTPPPSRPPTPIDSICDITRGS